MSNISDELDQEIQDYIDNVDYDRQRSLVNLRALFVKHLQLEEEIVELDAKNLDNIISAATSHFANDLPTKISLKGQLISPENGRILSIAVGTIAELKKTKALRKVVKFKFDEKY